MLTPRTAWESKCTVIQTVWKGWLWPGPVLAVASASVGATGRRSSGAAPLTSGPTRPGARGAGRGRSAASVDSVRWLREALLAVERVEAEPERELREPEDEELGFTKRALGASASSLRRRNSEGKI